MVTDSHHWLKAVGLFLSNLSGFSIFSLEVWIRASVAGRSVPLAAVIPPPTNLAISSGVSMVASWASVGSLVPGESLPIGRFHSYRSLSPLSSSLGGGGGEGDTAGLFSLLGGPLPSPPVPPVASPEMMLPGGVGPLAVRGRRGVLGDWIVGVWCSGTTTATFRISSWALASCLSSLAILSWSFRRSCSRPSTFC